jgi:hypothetical protein
MDRKTMWLPDRANDDVPSLPRALETRISDLTEWLNQEAPYCFDHQRHLDAGTREQAYWHYGYLLALRDVRDLISRSSYSKDTSNQNHSDDQGGSCYPED